MRKFFAWKGHVNKKFWEISFFFFSSGRPRTFLKYGRAGKKFGELGLSVRPNISQFRYISVQGKKWLHPPQSKRLYEAICRISGHSQCSLTAN
jgi:hypothetical protein